MSSSYDRVGRRIWKEKIIELIQNKYIFITQKSSLKFHRALYFSYVFCMNFFINNAMQNANIYWQIEKSLHVNANSTVYKILKVNNIFRNNSHSFDDIAFYQFYGVTLLSLDPI